ncbi:MAG TPA: hypothetical protein VGH39_17620 [Xanthobacteraceae bacterium]
MTTTRRLAAILAADVAGIVAAGWGGRGRHPSSLKTIQAELFDLTIGTHNGWLVKTTCDGHLV